MKRPRLIEFTANNLTLLQQSVLAVMPEEGCALLIGEKIESNLNQCENIWRIHAIWPCCNIWAPDKASFCDGSNSKNASDFKKLSRKNRFLLDPREQILAQRWARANCWEVLGDAHSHPQGKAIPSAIDRNTQLSPRLMVIVDSLRTVRSWWIENKPEIEPIELNYRKINSASTS